jgi:hypothetical protein
MKDKNKQRREFVKSPFDYITNLVDKVGGSNDNTEFQSMSRRGFLKGTGLAISGIALSSYLNIPSIESDEDSATSFSPVKAQTSQVNVQDYGATGDGQTDDTQAIRDAANDAAPDGTVYFPAGTYILGSNEQHPLEYPNDGSWDNLTWRGESVDNTTLKVSDGHDSYHTVFRMTPSNGITGAAFQNLTMNGSQMQQDGRPGIAIKTDSDDAQFSGTVTLENCHITNFVANGVTAERGTWEITNCRFSEIGQRDHELQGIASHAITIFNQEITIEDTIFEGIWGTDLDISTDGVSGHNVTVDNCISIGSQEVWDGFLKVNPGNQVCTVRKTVMRDHSGLVIKANPQTTSVGRIELENILIDGGTWTGIDFPSPGVLNMDQVAIKNVNTEDKRGGGLFTDGMNYDNCGQISIHNIGSNNDLDALLIENASGSIEEVIYGGTSPPSSWEDSGVVQTTSAGDPLQPDIPSENEIGPNSGSSENDASPNETGFSVPDDALNVMDYGAVGDGETDDTDAINAALDDAEPGDTVFIPEPDEFYLVDSNSRAAVEFHRAGPDVTITGEPNSAGDGTNCMLKMADQSGSSSTHNRWVAGIEANVDENLTGLEIKKLKFDGNRETQPYFEEFGVNGFNFYPGGEGHDILFEDIIIQNASASGFKTNDSSDITVRRMTIRNNRRHGFGPGASGNGSESDPGFQGSSIKVVDNGEDGNGTGMDVTAGYVQISDIYLDNNEQGYKIGSTGGQPHYLEITNANFRNANVNGGWRLTGDESSLEDVTLVFDNVQFINSYLQGFGAQGQGTYDIGTMHIDNANQAGQGNEFGMEVEDGAEVNADELRIQNTNETAGIENEGNGSVNVDTYYHYNNDGGPIGDGDISVGNQINEEKSELDVPGPNDVGAFTDGSTSGGQDTSEQTSSLGGTDNSISISSASGDQVIYLFTVDGFISSTGSNDVNDQVFGNRAKGTVSSGSDEYGFNGNLKEFYAKNSAEITLNNETYSKDELKQQINSCQVPNQPDSDGNSEEQSNNVEPTEFVGVQGTDFRLNGEDFHYLGANNHHLPIVASGQYGEQYVDDWMQYASDHGITVVRTWGFPPAWTGTDSHAGPNDFGDEEWYEHFDYIIDSARRHGIRLVIPLINNHYDSNSAPSPEAYASWSDSASTHNSFFQDNQANDYYKNYIENFLTRENSITGTEYRNEPAIMMWECGNEIETYGSTESLAYWFDEIATFIKSIDSNHLVSTGMHGQTGNVFNDMGTRNEYVDAHQPDSIDAASFHFYPSMYRPDDGSMRIEGIDRFEEYVRYYTNRAHEDLNKPAYFGEFGASVAQNFTISDRNRFFETAIRVAKDEGLSGILFWYPELERIGRGGQYHQILPGESSTWNLLDSYGEWALDNSADSIAITDPSSDDSSESEQEDSQGDVTSGGDYPGQDALPDPRNVDASNPMIYMNDLSTDNFCDEIMLALASKGEIDLRGYIESYPGQTWISEEEYQTRKESFVTAHRRARNLAVDSGADPDLPPAELGLFERHTQPSSGNPLDAEVKGSAGTDRIIAEANAASPENPLVVTNGGDLCTLADALLKDPSIADSIVVYSSMAGAEEAEFPFNRNASGYSAQIVMELMSVVIVSRGGGVRITRDQINQVPNPLRDFMLNKSYITKNPDTPVIDVADGSKFNGDANVLAYAYPDLRNDFRQVTLSGQETGWGSTTVPTFAYGNSNGRLWQLTDYGSLTPRAIPHFTSNETWNQ